MESVYKSLIFTLVWWPPIRVISAVMGTGFWVVAMSVSSLDSFDFTLLREKRSSHLFRHHIMVLWCCCCCCSSRRNDTQAVFYSHHDTYIQPWHTMKSRNFFTFCIFHRYDDEREQRATTHTSSNFFKTSFSPQKHKIQKKIPKIKNERRRFLLLSSMDRGPEYWR